MIKILIVDDEALVRKGLSAIIGKYSDRYVICGLAADGDEAIKIAEKEFPDIIITDIRMHNVSGIELLKWAKNNMPAVHTVVISGYDDVEYLHEAISNRAAEYLLKPVDKKQLFAVLDQIAEKIEERTLMLKKIAVAERSYSRYAVDFCEKLFCSGRINREDAVVFLDSIGVPVEQQTRMCVLLVKNTVENNSEISVPEDEELFNFGIKNIFDEMLSELEVKFIGYVSKEKGYILYMLIPGGLDVKIVAESICHKIKEVLNQELTVGISDVFGDIEETSRAREKAEIAFHSRLVKGCGVYEYNTVDYGEGHIEGVIEYSQSLYEAVEKTNGARVEKIIDGIDSVILNQVSCPQFCILRILEDFRDRIRVFLNKMPEISDGYIQSFFKVNLMDFEGLGQIKEYLKAVCVYIIEQIESKRVSACSKKIHEAKVYINDFYYDNISLNETAKRLCISSNYLSERFKKETGVTFIDYLTKVRVEKAKELLKENDLSIGQISEMVGYENSTYFNKVFKKHTGMTPGFFRSKLK